MKKKKRFLLYLLVTATILSCKNQISVGKTVEKKSSTPYATEVELINLKNEGFINYKVSRYFANIAMNEFAETNNWNNVVLSEYPIVIYNNLTDEPRYYEFRVIADDMEIGAISCAAKETEGDAVQFVLPYTLSINDKKTARAVQAGNYKLTDARYPLSFVIKNTDTARMSDSNGREIEDDILVDMTIKEFLSQSDELMLEDLGIDKTTADQLIYEQNKLEAEISEYWNAIKENESIIISTTDEEILQAYNNLYGNDSSRKITTSTSESIKLLTSWENKSKWSNPGGWCGPSCMSFITLGLGADSGYDNVPLRNSSYAINQMYKDFEDKIGTGPKVFSQLSAGLSSLTDYKLVTDFGHFYSEISKNINNKNLPVVSLRGSKGLTADTIQWHYRTIIGTKTVTRTTKVTAFGKTLLSFKDVDNYYAIHDNGVDGPSEGYFFESSFKLYHLWSAHVEKK